MATDEAEQWRLDDARAMAARDRLEAKLLDVMRSLPDEMIASVNQEIGRRILAVREGAGMDLFILELAALGLCSLIGELNAERRAAAGK